MDWMNPKTICCKVHFWHAVSYRVFRSIHYPGLLWVYTSFPKLHRLVPFTQAQWGSRLPNYSSVAPTLQWVPNSLHYPASLIINKLWEFLNVHPVEHSFPSNWNRRVKFYSNWDLEVLPTSSSLQFRYRAAFTCLQKTSSKSNI